MKLSPAPAHFGNRPCFLALFLLLGAAQVCFGWGKDGHKIINRAAVQTLPANMPAFLRTPRALDEIVYLGPEADRWRSESELSAAQAPNHFIDLELADIAAPDGLPRRRFEFFCDLAAARREYPNIAYKLTPQRVGLLPWQADEVFERLRNDMRDYRRISAAHKDAYGVEQAILYDVGWLGHYAGDGSQPLHTTIDYDGWVERSNPEGFARNRGIHSLFETEFVRDNIRASDVRPLVPATPRVLKHPFRDFVAYLRTTHACVPEVYRLYKRGAFSGHGSAQSRAFTSARLAAGAAMFRNMIYTAWVQSAEPVPHWQDRRR